MSSDFANTSVNTASGQDNETAKSPNTKPLDRRHFLVGAAAGAAAMALPRWARADMYSSSSGLGLAAFRTTYLPFALKSPSAMTNRCSGCSTGSSSLPSPPKIAA